MKLFAVKGFAVSLIMSMIVLCGCSVESLLKTYAEQSCEYYYNSIKDVTISNINVSNGVSAADTPKILLMLNSLNQSIPLNFVLVLEVQYNFTDGAKGVTYAGMTYKVFIDGIEFANGETVENFSIYPKQKKLLPLKVGTDIAKLAEKNSKDAVINMVKNFIGIGSEKTKGRIELRPILSSVNGKTVLSPMTLPVTFTFGGGK